MMQWCAGRRKSGTISGSRKLIVSGKENVPQSRISRIPSQPKGQLNPGFGSTESLASTAHPAGFKSSGQLQLRFAASQRGLRVCVLQARHIRLPGSASSCNTFAQLSIADEPLSFCCTAEVRGSNNPVFKQSFTYNIDHVQLNGHRRLTLRLCNRDANSGRIDILGSTSFGLRHLLSRIRRQDKQDGWYYLLNESLGAKKHLRVPSTSKPAPVSSADLSTVNLDARNLPTLKINIKERKDGYGFSLKSGSCPVRISTIRPGGSAQDCGLQSGDVILAIQGRNVSRSCSRSVAELIRQLGGDVQLEIGRPSFSTSTLSLQIDDVIPEQSPEPKVVIKNILEDFPVPQPECALPENVRLMPSFLSTTSPTKAAPPQPTRTASPPFFNQNLDDSSPLSCSPIEQARGGDERLHAEEARSIDLSSDVYSPSLEEESPMRMPIAISMDLIYPLRLGESLCATPKRKLCFSDDEDDTSLATDVWDKLELSVIEEETSPSPKRSRVFSSCSPGVYHSTPSDDVRASSSDEASFCSVDVSLVPNIHSDQELSMDSVSQTHGCSRLRAMADSYRRFVDLEQSFCVEMQAGVRNISRQLRHQLTMTQHSVIFRNIEKLTLLSAHQVALLKREEPEADVTSPKQGWRCIGAIYRSQLNVLRDAFGLFVRGVKSADLALRQTDLAEMDIVKTLIDRPLQHFEELFLMLKNALNELECSHPEESLKTVVEGLTDVYNQLKNN